MAALIAKVRRAFHGGGGLGAARYWNRNKVRILTYHRFPSHLDSALRAQCDHIRKYYSVVSMDQVARWLRGDQTLPQNALAVTVDDGYRDAFTVAYPIFSEYEIPATVFLATDFVDGKSWVWVNQVRWAVENTPLDVIRIQDFVGRELVAPVRSQTERDRCALLLIEGAKEMSNEERTRVVADLPELLQTRLPTEIPADYAPVSWEEVRQMARAGMDFGAHTKTHVILSRVSGADGLREEIAGSKRRIAPQLLLDPAPRDGSSRSWGARSRTSVTRTANGSTSNGRR